MNQSYGNTEKLKHKKKIEKLFTDGKSIGQFPIRLFYLEIATDSLMQSTRSGVSVSKRNFKNAVDRNKIKRMLREAYRKNKYLVNYPDGHRYWLMLVYVSKELPAQKALENAVIKSLRKLKNLKK